jgi:hypothetical protein
MTPIAEWSLRVAASVVLGATLAVVASYAVFVGSLSVLNLVVWSVSAVLIGFLSRRLIRSLVESAVTGFVIVVLYSVLGYRAETPVWTALPVFALLGLAGAVGMAAASLIGSGLARATRVRASSTVE